MVLNVPNYTIYLIEINKFHRPQIFIVIDPTLISGQLQIFDLVDEHIDERISLNLMYRRVRDINNDEDLKWRICPKKSCSSNSGALCGRWANLSTASWYWSMSNIICMKLFSGVLTQTNDISWMSDLSGTKSQACIVSPPSSWHAQPYWANWVFWGISSRMIDTGLLKWVASNELHPQRSREGFHRSFGGSKNI